MATQIWHDVDSDKYYLLNLATGEQTACDRFGQAPARFTPYATGFPKELTSSPRDYTPKYTPQPSNC